MTQREAERQVRAAYSDDDIIRYYDTCWSARFRNGHNPVSLAIHFGYYRTGKESSEAAKLALNAFLAEQLAIGRVPFSLLDAGCGVGGTAIDLARRFPKLRAVGVNLSAEQVMMAESFALREGMPDRLDFRCASYLETGLPDGSFDGIACIESLCHCSDRPRFLAQARRLLRSGGRLCVIDFFRTSRDLSGAELVAYREIIRAFALADYYEVPLDTLAKRAGFRPIRMIDITRQVRPGIERSARRALDQARRFYAVDDSLELRHLRGCIGLLKLVSSGGLVYAACVVENPSGRAVRVAVGGLAAAGSEARPRNREIRSQVAGGGNAGKRRRGEAGARDRAGHGVGGREADGGDVGADVTDGEREKRVAVDRSVRGREAAGEAHHL
jgi:cyclopropane fatty-acyl-phospholipid synthase-like methyltransferase